MKSSNFNYNYLTEHALTNYVYNLDVGKFSLFEKLLYY